MKPVLTIVGGGMGDPELLTGAARRAVETAQRLFAPPRLAESLAAINPRIRGASTREIAALLDGAHADATVIVSGDAGFYSLSRTLGDSLGEQYEICTLSGISSLQTLCARLCVPWDSVHVVSLHGRGGSLPAAVSYHPRVFALTGGDNGVSALLEELCACGLEHVAVAVGENLSAPGERVTRGAASSLAGQRFDSLAVLYVENTAPANPDRRLRDDDFLRGGVPMTKEAVRTLSVSRLDVRPRDTVWDVGAGTGSVSVALAYAARAGRVIAVERGAEGAALIRQNRDKLGAHNIQVVEGEAPGCLAGLPAPHRVFVGGSGGRMEDILRLAAEASPAFTVCMNTVTLESQAEALHCLDTMGFLDVEVLCINAAAARTAGKYRLMTAENPVHILTGRWSR